MRLSEAIRLGAMATEPVHGPIFSGGSDGRICGTCAIGSVLYALYGEDARRTLWEHPRYDGHGAVDAAEAFIAEHWPWTASFRTVSPAYCVETSIVSAIVGLFENQQWTREQIADWVETIEAQHAPRVEPVAEAVTVRHA